MIERNLGEQLADETAYMVVQRRVIGKLGRTRGVQSTVGSQHRKAADGIGGGLREAHAALQLVAQGLVAGGLATPGGAIGPYLVALDTEHGAVIVEEGGSLDMLAPQAGVGTLASATLAEEEDGTIAVDDAAAMDGHGAVGQHHEAIAYPEGKAEEVGG